MTMLNKAQILQLLEARDGRALRDLWRGRSAVDIAALLDTVEDPRRQAALFRTLPKKAAADVFAYLPGPTQARLAASFAEGELQELFDGLQPDDAAGPSGGAARRPGGPQSSGLPARSGGWP